MKKKYAFGSLNLNNNLIDVQGPKHEQGGVSINNEVEIEGGESVFDNFTFSDRLTVPRTDKTFSDEAKRIEKTYANDDSALARDSKAKEFKRLALLQEEVKSDLVATPDVEEGGKRKLFAGGLIAAGLPAAINIGRGLFGKARKFDQLNFGRVDFDNVEFDEVAFDNVDFSEQRNQAALDTERNRLTTNATIRNNANSVGQLLGNTLVNNARNLSDLNSLNRESFQTEGNTNVEIGNRENLINTQIGNQENQLNSQINNQENQLNTQIGNQELLQNFQIDQINAANEDAQQELLFQGLGQLAGGFGSFMNNKANLNNQRDLLSMLGPNVDGIGNLFNPYNRTPRTPSIMQPMPSRGFSF